ncbi:Telomerase reverse transcriptase [Liparis tanakae]|uniref:Telomerase reverse transcriptase n=1 Tax=Liparis tanakae TaxID=230148 RepID=A0A4Z2FBQ4_9TELE|nr:Telomerase reverse transcriptase [Liparis tanakae]
MPPPDMSTPDMPPPDMSPALDILRSVYRHTETLEEFAGCVVFRDGRRAALVEPTDSLRFRSFVRGVFVCFDQELKQVPSGSQICSLPELLAFVVNNLTRKRKKNTLAHGYSFLSVAREQRDADHFKFQGDVTQSAAYIHGSDLWKKATARLGTDLTRHLLESCSVFVAVPPSCLFQVCGAPIYDRVNTTRASTGFYLQPRSARARGVGGVGGGVGSVGGGVGGVSNVGGVGGVGGIGGVGDGVGSVGGVGGVVCGGVGGIGVGSSAWFVRDRGAATWKRKREAQSLAAGRTRTERRLRGRTRKRKREADQKEEEEGMMGKRRRVGRQETFIRTLRLLYGGRGMRGFLLNRRKKSAAGCGRLRGEDLVRTVFFEGTAFLNGPEGKPRKLPRRFFRAAPLFGRLLRQHERCPYGRTLRRTCPVAEAGGGAEPGRLSALLPRHCAPRRVYLFVKECLRAVVPPELWGSDHNRLQFFFRVRAFLSSGKFERLSLAELMWKMRVNDCDWAKISRTARVPPSELAYRTRILGRLLAWLLEGYVAGLVRACFYVTESVGQKNAVRFYRQEVWAKVQELAFRAHLSKGQMEELTPAQVAALPKDTVVSRLRFIPKTDSMRPITRVVGADAKTRVDVSGAYESLPHDKLLEVIGQVLTPVQEELFTSRRYAKIWADSHEGVKKSFVRQADFLEGNMSATNMKGFVTSLQKSGKVHHAILVEQHFCSDLSGRDALQFFTQMLTGSVVQFGKK